ncbi:terpene synthase family protein [Kibdelosporangium phytohabitans]|uniref:Terpene synthase n=1 Tax=Kibdelosporangium phytohabitans TaxID=860235 RepID=A0A0N9I8A9_9PSEU|nr:hypothetical protein [Kibdelosporangium phytohabitans]ALG12137.1 hypothetical protein AOZ06_39460 [Kibdelosporangium phytohabitans]MBE1463647.1 hypothetical protein [Kibdelosporangium phytohabitans]
MTDPHHDDLVSGGVPLIYCPISPAVHPLADVVNRHAVDWMRQRGLCPDSQAVSRLEQLNCGALVARLFPYGNLKALETIAKFHCWGFVMDDIVERQARVSLPAVTDQHFGMVRMLDAPECGVLAEDAFAQAFREIHDEFAELAAPGVHARWIDMNRSFAAGVLWAAVHRHAGLVPDPDVVTTIRPMDSGAFGYGIGLMELAGGFEVPAAELNRPDVRRLTDITAVILAWDNDIYSYQKEVEQDVDCVNLVTSLAEHHGQDRRTALAHAIRMRNQAMWCYLRHRRQLVPSGGVLDCYLRGLDHQIRGNLDWGLRATRRYATVDAPALVMWERPTGELNGDSLDEPIDLPSIRWWWEGSR